MCTTPYSNILSAQLFCLQIFAKIVERLQALRRRRPILWKGDHC